jgi:hypothetical protein
MRASFISREVLESAAAEIGVRAEIDCLNAGGTRFRVKLFPIVPAEALTASGRRKRGEKGNAPYQRISTSAFSPGRRVHAVCWHGFRDFFRACFRSAPNAVFYTALDTWRGSEDFESRYAASGHKNAGSKFSPVMWAEACECGEEGYAK